MTIAEKKKLKEPKKKSCVYTKKLKQMRKSSKEARSPTLAIFPKKEGHFFRDSSEVEKLRKLSASTSLGYVTPFSVLFYLATLC